MAANVTPFEEVELSKKHEDILGKRAVLLRQMDSRYEQQRSKRKQQLMQSQAAQQRNAQLLQDLQKIEDRLRTRPIPHSNVVTLETRYWASVEEKIPEWESFLLGKSPAPPPGDDTGKLVPRRRKPKAIPQNHSLTQDKSLPPRPNVRSVR